LLIVGFSEFEGDVFMWVPRFGSDLAICAFTGWKKPFRTAKLFALSKNGENFYAGWHEGASRCGCF
jgi:hypothetical protein